VSNYIKGTNFTVKDGLAQGDPGKIVKGTEVDIELNAIAAAISTKADSNSPTFTGTPSAPTANLSTNNTQIATTAFALAAAAAAFPIGGIIIWSGSIANVPSGWALCDGTNGTPNLRDRFVVGAGTSYAVNNTGGSKDSIVVAHTHTATVTDPGHRHNLTLDDGVTPITGGSINISAWNGRTMGATTASGGTLKTDLVNTGIGVTNASTGSSGTDANLPPYYALAYIQRIA
jgi:hypothetical protein